MTEFLFYHLKGQTPEQVLPGLLQKSIERGWRVVVQASSEERIEALDAHLWTWRDDAFLPHGTWHDAEAAEQPDVVPHRAGHLVPVDDLYHIRTLVTFSGAP